MESNSNKDMIWDTTQNYYHYPHFIKKEYLNYYVNCERKYHKWLENISINYHKDIDWWASSPINRNPYSSDLYKSICIILTIKKLIKKKKLPTLIYVETIFLKKTIEKNINFKTNICQIIPKKKKLYFYFFFIRNINAVILFLKSYFLTIIFVKKKKINSDSLTLIDTFITNKDTREKPYYGNIYNKYFANKSTFFVPTITYNNFFNFIEILKILNTKNFFFKENFLSFSDLFYCLNHIFRKKKFYKNYKKYSNIDLSLMIYKEIKYNLDYNSIFVCLSNYLFSNRLKKNNIKIKKVINWFENQCIDKGWNLGFRSNFKDSELVGYQALPNLPILHHLCPSEYEYKCKVVPNKIGVINKSLLKERSKFIKDKKLFVLSPSLKSEGIFKKKKSSKKKYKIILFLEGNQAEEDLNVIKKFIYVANKLPKIKIYIKKHPSPVYKNLSIELPDNIKFIDFKFSYLAKNTLIAACSGASTTVLQSLAYGCRLLIPSDNGYDKKTLKSLNIPNENFAICDTKFGIFDAVKYFTNKKKSYKNINPNSMFEKINKENIKIFY